MLSHKGNWVHWIWFIYFFGQLSIFLFSNLLYFVLCTCSTCWSVILRGLVKFGLHKMDLGKPTKTCIYKISYILILGLFHELVALALRWSCDFVVVDFGLMWTFNKSVYFSSLNRENFITKLSSPTLFFFSTPFDKKERCFWRVWTRNLCIFSLPSECDCYMRPFVFCKAHGMILYMKHNINFWRYSIS